MTYKIFASSLLSRSTSAGMPELVGAVRTPGRSGSGAVPSSRSDGGGLWSATFGSIFARTANHVRYWTAMHGYLAEGATPIVVPFCLKKFMPAPIVDGSPLYSYGNQPFDDGSLFDDGAGFYMPVVIVSLTADAALRATTLEVEIEYGAEFVGGELFSIEHDILSHRLYTITSIDGDSITIEPPLREATPLGVRPDFDAPKCVMQLAGSGAMTLPLEMRRHGRGDIRFIESYLPAPSPS